MLCKNISQNKRIFLAIAVLTFFLLNITSVFALTYETVQDVYGILGDGTERTGAYNITFKVRSCDDSACSGEVWSSFYTNATYNDISSLSNNRYFQYQALFYTENQNYTPMLFNVTSGYTILDLPPNSVNLISPEDEQTLEGQEQTFTCNATDSNGNLQNISLYHNATGTWHLNATNNVSGSENETSFVVSGLPYTTFVWNCLATDSNGLSSFADSNFTLTTIADATDDEYPTFSNYYDNNATLVNSGTGLFNVTLANTNGTVWLEINNTNITASNLSANVYNVSYNFTNSGTYSYRWYAYGNGSSHNLNNSGLRYYTVNYSDTLYPIFSSSTQSPANNSNYTYGQAYQFNITIANTNGTAGIQFNGTNYTLSNISSVFNRTLASLGAGTYTYYYWSFGNGSSQNYNTSAIYYYTLNKATPTLTFLANGGTSNLSLIYPAQVNISATANYGTVGLDKDGVNYLANNGVNVTLPAGSYIFRANITGNQNYSSVGYSYYNVTITSSARTGTLLLNGTAGDINITYPSQVNASFTNSSTAVLYRNGVDVTLLNNAFENLGVGYYNFTLIVAGDENYTGFTLTRFANITKASATLGISGTTPITFGTITNVAGSGCPAELTCTLSPANGTFGVGVVTFNYSTPGNVNYSASSITRDITINQASQSITPLLNGANSNLAVTFPQQVNASFTGTNNSALTLTINGTAITPGTNYTFGANSYVLNWSLANSQNYSGINYYLNLTVNQAASNVSAWINNSRSNFTSYNGTNIWLNATLQAGSGPVTLYLNGSIINSGTAPLSNLTNLSNGFYNLTAVYSNSQNYSSSSETWWINVSTAPAVVDLVYPIFSSYQDNNGTLTGSGYAWFNVTLANTNGTVFLQINNTNITATNLTANIYNVSVNLTAGTYSYYWGSWGNGSSSNYNISLTRYYTVNATVSDTVYPIFSNYYDNDATLTGSGTGLFNVTLTNTNGTVWLEINNTNITASNLSANVYNVSYVFTLNGTYSYTWWAYGNGTNKNMNSSGVRSYTVLNSSSLIIEYSITSSLTSGETAVVRARILNSSEISAVWVAINNSGGVLTNYTMLQEGIIDFYNSSFEVGKIGNYKYKIYFNYSSGNLIDNFEWQTFSVSAPATATNEVYPVYALPSSSIVVTVDLLATDLLKEVNVTLNVPYGFEFPFTSYLQTQTMNNFSVLQTKTAKWFVYLPNNETTYTFNVTWNDKYNNSWQSSNRELIVTYDATDLTNATNVNIIVFPELEAGDVLESEIQVRDINGDFVNASSVKISLYDPNNNLVVDNVNYISQLGIGRYFYKYTTPPTPTGQWLIYVNVTRQGNSFIDREYFRLTGGPFDIRDITITDSTTPTLGISVILENMGDGVTDIVVDWNLTRTSTGALLDSGQDTIGVTNEVTHTITPSTTYTGEAQITFLGTWSSTEKAGAQKTFTITSAPSSDNGDTGGSSGGGGGSITGRATEEVICNPPYIRYGKECCLDANNNSICDKDEILESSEDNKTGAGEVGQQETPAKTQTFLLNALDKISNFFKPAFSYIKQNNIYFIISFGSLIFVLLLIIIIVKISRKRKKSKLISGLETKLKHLKELKHKNKISEKSYHTEKEELLQKINKILKNKHFLLIFGAFVLISLFAVTFKPSGITGGVIGTTESISINWWTIFAILVILFLIGIFGILFYILREIRKIKAEIKGKKILSGNFEDKPEESEDNKDSDKGIITKEKYETKSISELINKQVYTNSGYFMGKVKEVLLGKNKIDSLKIKLDKKQKFKHTGIIIKYNNVKNIGHVVIIDSEILDKIKFLKD